MGEAIRVLALFLAGLVFAYLAYLFLAWPFIVAAIRRELIEARRRKKGCCIRCGYDLRASGESVVCPECGELVANSVGTGSSGRRKPDGF